MQMSREELGESVYYLIPSTIVKVEFSKKKPSAWTCPLQWDMKVIQTEPTCKRPLPARVMKPATLEPDWLCRVPRL